MRYFTLLFLLLFQAYSWAQLQRGDQLLSTSNVIGPSGPNAHLSQLYFGPATQGTQWLIVSPRYGFALTDRFVLGAQVFSLADIDRQFGNRLSFTLLPHARYYYINTPKLRAFTQVTSGIRSSFREDRDSQWYLFNSVVAATGVQWPVAPNILLTPQLTYHVEDGPNSVGLHVAAELVLGRNNRGEQPVVGRLERHTVMVGIGLASLTIEKDASDSDATVGGYYFFTNRFALGAALGLSHSRRRRLFRPRQDKLTFTTTDVSFGVFPRYYLNSAGYLRWFAEVGGELTQRYSTVSANTDGLENASSTDVALIVGGGVQLFVRDNIALEFGPRFEYFTEVDRPLYTLNFGIRFLL